MLTPFAMRTSCCLLLCLVDVLLEVSALPTVKVWGLVLQGTPPTRTSSLASCSEGGSLFFETTFPLFLY